MNVSDLLRNFITERSYLKCSFTGVHKSRAHNVTVMNEYFIDLLNVFDRQVSTRFNSSFWNTEF